MRLDIDSLFWVRDGCLEISYSNCHHWISLSTSQLLKFLVFTDLGMKIPYQETLPGFKLASAWADRFSTDRCTLRCMQLSDLLNDSNDNAPDAFSCVLSDPYFWSKESQEPWMHVFMYSNCIERLRSDGRLTHNCLLFPESMDHEQLPGDEMSFSCRLSIRLLWSIDA